MDHWGIWILLRALSIHGVAAGCDYDYRIGYWCFKAESTFIWTVSFGSTVSLHSLSFLFSTALFHREDGTSKGSLLTNTRPMLDIMITIRTCVRCELCTIWISRTSKTGGWYHFYCCALDGIYIWAFFSFYSLYSAELGRVYCGLSVHFVFIYPILDCDLSI